MSRCFSFNWCNLCKILINFYDFTGQNTGSHYQRSTAIFANVGSQITKRYASQTILRDCCVSCFQVSCIFIVQSVQFHERGEGHKAQVARRLTELTRKGEIEYRQQQQVNTDLQRMEEAALRAYHKDLTSNPDLSARVSFHLVHE